MIKKLLMKLKNTEPELYSMELPPILLARYRKLLVFGIVFSLFSIPVAFIQRDSNWLPSFLIFLITGFCIILYAMIFKTSIKTKGFFMKHGEITFVKESFSANISNRKTSRPIYYHIQTPDGEVYHVPVFKTSEEFPVGTVITIYAPANVTITNSSGIYRMTPFWCYERYSENEPESQDTLHN